MGRGSDRPDDQPKQGARLLFGARQADIERRSAARQQQQQQALALYQQGLDRVRQREKALGSLEAELFRVISYGRLNFSYPSPEIETLPDEMLETASCINTLIVDHQALIAETGINPDIEFPALLNDLRSSADRLAEAAACLDRPDKASQIGKNANAYSELAASRAQRLRKQVVDFISQRLSAERQDLAPLKPPRLES